MAEKDHDPKNTPEQEALSEESLDAVSGGGVIRSPTFPFPPIPLPGPGPTFPDPVLPEYL